jgi:hypothetical protein
MENKEKLSNTIWHSIYRQWIWADHLRNYFSAELPEKKLSLSGDFTIEPYWMLMCLWYGVLFSVLEALREIKVNVPEVQKDIDKMYLTLKKYRNAVFHVQKEYWSNKWRNLILDETSAKKINLIHKQVGIFLLENLTKKS